MQKVVKLLQEMQDTLKKEMEEDEEIYELMRPGQSNPVCTPRTCPLPGLPQPLRRMPVAPKDRPFLNPRLPQITERRELGAASRSDPPIVYMPRLSVLGI